MNGVDFNFNPIDWLTRMVVLIETHGLMPSVETLAYSLAAALFAYGMIRAIWYGRGSELAALAGRSLLVVALVSLLPSVRSVVFTSWTSVYSYSSEIWGTDPGAPFDQLLSAAEEARDVLPSFLATSYAVEAASHSQYHVMTEGLGAEEPSDAATALSRVVTWVAALVFTVLLPILFGVYTVVVFVSGMTVLFGIVLLPITAALLLAPGGMAVSWMGAWLRMNLGALFVVAFLPVAVSIVVELGIAHPLERTNQAMQQSVDSFDAAVSSLDSAFQNLRDAIGQIGPLPGNAQATIDAARQDFYDAGEQALSGIMAILLGWLFGILTILIGFLVGLLLLLRMERYVMGFLGGLASGVGGVGFLSRALTFRALRSVASHGGGRSSAAAGRAGSSGPPSGAAPGGYRRWADTASPLGSSAPAASQSPSVASPGHDRWLPPAQVG